MSTKQPREQRIGVTETSDPCFHLDIFRRLYKGNIIITKRLTDKFIEKLVEHKDKIILHLTCTGFGHSIIEPFVPSVEELHKKFIELIEKGFPIEHVVLRVDPIVPTDKGIETAISVLRAFGGLGIPRVRISFLDNYAHVKKRFNEAKIEELYGGNFHAPLYLRIHYSNIFEKAAKENGFEVIESCGEPSMESTPCLSQKDIEILGLSDDIVLEGSAEQRTHCKCPSNKSELIKEKPQRCQHKCIYCYWRD
jgi:DNA repair photolyase